MQLNLRDEITGLFPHKQLNQLVRKVDDVDCSYDCAKANMNVNQAKESAESEL